MAWLSDGEKISKISLLVLAQLTNVTDRRTDRPTDGHRMPAIAALCSVHSIARQKIRFLTECRTTLRLSSSRVVLAAHDNCERETKEILPFQHHLRAAFWLWVTEPRTTDVINMEAMTARRIGK